MPAPRLPFASTLPRSLRLAARRLAKAPGFTTTAILSLALGIGASTAIFSLVHKVLIHDLPLASPDELVEVYETTPGSEYGIFSYPDFEDFRDGTSEVFSGVAATRLLPTQADRDGSVEPLMIEAVSGNFFPLLGIEAQLGRTLLPSDDVTPGGHPVVLLTDDYWQRRFAGDPAVVGQTMRLGGRAYTIVGIAPAAYPGSFRSLAPALFAPITMTNELMPTESDQLTARRSHSIFVKARLQPGVGLARAQGVADAVAADLRSRAPDGWDPDGGFLLLPTEQVILFPPVDDFIRAASVLLLAAVGLVMLMACTNLASFLLAKALERRQEIALRLALGAGRTSLVGQMLTETLLLGLAGGIAGVGVAAGLLRILATADLPLPIPIDLHLSLNSSVLLFSLLLSIAAGLLLGLAPAFQNLRQSLNETLRSESSGSGVRLRLRNGLVVAQVAMSLLLLLVAGLFVRSMEAMQSVDPGFGRQPTALLSVLIPTDRYDPQQGRVMVERLRERLGQVAGAGEVGLIDNLHLDVMNNQAIGFQIDGVEPPPGRPDHLADFAKVDPHFFTAAGVEIVRGRNFDRHDLDDGRAVAIVNQAFADAFWPGREAIGQLVRTDDDDLQVVGIASMTKIRSIGESPRPLVYLPYSQNYSSTLTAMVPTRGDPENALAALVAAAREVDPELFIWQAKTIERHLAIVLLPARLSALILSVFAALALTLAVVGLYGVVSYAVAQRRREVGIRMALGADGRSVVRLLMGSGLRLVTLGSLLGLLLAAGAAQGLGGLLFGLSTLDPFTFVVWPLVFGLVAAVAALLPARSASRVDPARVLRSE